MKTDIKKAYNKLSDIMDKTEIAKTSMPSILASNIYVEGKIESSGTIEIEGKVNGSIKAKSVIIRSKGFCEGDIFADSIDIHGHFSGNLDITNIKVSKKAVVKGKFLYDSLIVEDGSSIEGEFKKKSDKKNS